MRKIFLLKPASERLVIKLMIQNFGFLPSKMKIYKLQMSFLISNVFIDSENAPGVCLLAFCVDIC